MSMMSLQDEFTVLLRGEPADPYSLYARMRAEAPIFHSDATSGWVASRRDDVARVLQDEDHCSRAQARRAPTAG